MPGFLQHGVLALEDHDRCRDAGIGRGASSHQAEAHAHLAHGDAFADQAGDALDHITEALQDAPSLPE
eukprot:3057659-Prymnesium_polylepis.1